MIAATQNHNAVNQLLKGVGKIHKAFESEGIEEKYRIDESYEYESITTELQLYQAALRDGKDRLSSIEQRLIILCKRYIDNFSRHVKD